MGARSWPDGAARAAGAWPSPSTRSDPESPVGDPDSQDAPDGSDESDPGRHSHRGDPPASGGLSRTTRLPPPSRERFRKADRLRKRSEFTAARSQGRRVHTRHFVLLALPDAERHPVTVRPLRPEATRLGVTVTKRTFKQAVRRNRVKRVLREVFRRNRALFPPGIDLVIIAKAGADALSYQQVRDELAQVSRALHRAVTAPAPRHRGPGDGGKAARRGAPDRSAHPARKEGGPPS